MKKGKFVIGIVLMVIILLENYFQPGLMFHMYDWTIGFLPWYMQTVVLAATVVLVAGAGSIFFGGWIGIPILAVMAAAPILGLNLSWVAGQMGLSVLRYMF